MLKFMACIALGSVCGVCWSQTPSTQFDCRSEAIHLFENASAKRYRSSEKARLIHWSTKTLEARGVKSLDRTSAAYVLSVCGRDPARYLSNLTRVVRDYQHRRPFDTDELIAVPDALRTIAVERKCDQAVSCLFRLELDAGPSEVCEYVKERLFLDDPRRVVAFAPKSAWVIGASQSSFADWMVLEAKDDQKVRKKLLAMKTLSPRVKAIAERILAQAR